MDQNTLSVQIKSLMIFEFLKEYNQLEHLIREKFEQNLPNLPSDILSNIFVVLIFSLLIISCYTSNKFYAA